jgi:hypothetical protein
MNLLRKRESEKIAAKDLAIIIAKVPTIRPQEWLQPFRTKNNVSGPIAYQEGRIQTILLTNADLKTRLRINRILTLVKLLQKGPKGPIGMHQQKVVHQSYHQNQLKLVLTHQPHRLQIHARVTSATLKGTSLQPAHKSRLTKVTPKLD